MSLSLEEIVPWGRTAAEYERMFQLGDAEHELRLLDCGGGPASFTAEWTALGRSVVAVDPLYTHSAEAIRSRFDAAAFSIMAPVRANPERWVWTYHASPDVLLARRTEALNRFLDDLEPGKRAGRYVIGSLPRLPFADRQFDLAVVSHLLFLYSNLLPGWFHRQALVELLRVATEVRIFPLLTLDSSPSPHFDSLVADLRNDGWPCDVLRVDYELQPGGNSMLRIHHPKKSSSNHGWTRIHTDRSGDERFEAR